jgi:predicted DCC family thiol-disulfide oxidoreductase YuxK
MNIILFDGVCNLCNATVLYLIKHDKLNNLHFAAQQTVSGKEIIAKQKIQGEPMSIVFIKQGHIYYKSDAIIEISKQLTGWPQILQYSFMIPKSIRNMLYDVIAKNRYRLFGKRLNCSIPAQENIKKFL